MLADNDNNDLELLIGEKAISAEMKTKPRQTYRMVYECGLPVFRLGGSIAIRRSTLRRWLEEKEREPQDESQRTGRGRPRKAA